jgi:hypothetical protein
MVRSALQRRILPTTFTKFKMFQIHVVNLSEIVLWCPLMYAHGSMKKGLCVDIIPRDR